MRRFLFGSGNAGLGAVVDRETAARLVSDLFEGWYPALVRAARRLCPSLETAEDMAQEAFFLLYRDLRLGKRIDFPRAWLLGVVRQQAGRQAWKRGRSRISFSGLEILDSLPAGRVPPDEPDGEVTRFLSQLSPRETDVLLLRMESLSYREIAGELGITANSVGTLLARALRKLQQAMGRGAHGAAESTHVETRVKKASN